jgi:maleate cis-trans isomerase
LATDLPTFEYLNDLEHELGVPILGSNQTLLWRALKFLGLATSRPLGRLLAS